MNEVRELDRNELRLLFMREGKFAARVWPWLDGEPSEAVRVQVLALIDAVDVDFARFTEEDRDSLLSVFYGAARKARTPEPPTPEQLAEVTPEALRSRVDMMRGAPAPQLSGWEATWRRPSVDSLATVASICANPGAPVSEADAAALYREVGRLAGPLWITGDWEHIPELALIAADSLDATIGEVVAPARRFDEARAEFRIPTREEVLKTFHGELLNSLRTSRSLYLADHPVGKLPSDPITRGAEEERRAAERALLVERALTAVDLIVQPLLEAIGMYAASRAVEADVQEAADYADRVRVRAAAGFSRPEPQRYGVSARGAELWVADALRWLGEHDAEVTQQAADGGVDVLSARLAVSVKHYSGAVPVEEVREIFGVAAASRRRAVLWTSGTLTGQARKFADLATIPVVTYDVETAQWAGANPDGEAFLAEFDVRASRNEEHDVRF